MSERPERVHLDTAVFEQLMLAVETLPGGQVWRLLAAAHADVKPYDAAGDAVPPEVPADPAG